MIQLSTFDKQIEDYQLKQNQTLDLLRIVNDLWFNRSIELVLFRNQLFDRRISAILSLHQQTKEFLDEELSILQTLQIANIIQSLELPASRIDIGKLALKVRKQQIDWHDLQKFIIIELAGAEYHPSFEPKDVVLYGFGRIGRLLARELCSKAAGGKQLRLRAIVTRDKVNQQTLEKRASLLRQDSIHGSFDGQVEIDLEKSALIINEVPVYIISASNPEEIDYTMYQINNALIIDNTGAFRDKTELRRHLTAKGSSQVLLTAPGKGIPNIVYGVNQGQIDQKLDSIFSAASCTTNAISPILSVIENEIGIEKGHVETIHSYTNDQNLVDNFHKKSRRGRAAALNMVITETGAGTAISKVIPSLDGKLTSNAIRVPVPNGSLAILNLELKNSTTLKDINGILKNAALSGELVEQIRYTDNSELVSADIIGTTAAAVLDSQATIVSNDGKNVVVYVWYDNEYGYSHQVMRLARHIAGVRRFTYY